MGIKLNLPHHDSKLEAVAGSNQKTSSKMRAKVDHTVRCACVTVEGEAECEINKPREHQDSVEEVCKILQEGPSLEPNTESPFQQEDKDKHPVDHE